MGVESLGLDPSDPQRLYLSTGLNYNNVPAQQNHFLLSDKPGRHVYPGERTVSHQWQRQRARCRRTLCRRSKLGTTIYYGSRTAGLWKSLDRGMTWNQVTTFPVTGKTAGAGVVFIIFNPSSGVSGTATPVLYAGVSDYNYYNANGSNMERPFRTSNRSVDSGATWQAIPGEPTSVANRLADRLQRTITSHPSMQSLAGRRHRQPGLTLHHLFQRRGASHKQFRSRQQFGAGAVYEYTPTVGTRVGREHGPTSPPTPSAAAPTRADIAALHWMPSVLGSSWSPPSTTTASTATPSTAA